MKEDSQVQFVECPKCHGIGTIYDEEGDECECDLCWGNGECDTDDYDYQDWLYKHTPGDIED